jgi:DNA-binding NarL/FixJ family response regulator
VVGAKLELLVVDVVVGAVVVVVVGGGNCDAQVWDKLRIVSRATGARPRRIALRGVESLTPSERRVAELAAQGPTNREIAQELFVTPRTVEVHPTSAYRKLGISSRSQLAGTLSELTQT